MTNLPVNLLTKSITSTLTWTLDLEHRTSMCRPCSACPIICGCFSDYTAWRYMQNSWASRAYLMHAWPLPLLADKDRLWRLVRMAQLCYECPIHRQEGPQSPEGGGNKTSSRKLNFGLDGAEQLRASFEHPISGTRCLSAVWLQWFLEESNYPISIWLQARLWNENCLDHFGLRP